MKFESLNLPEIKDDVKIINIGGQDIEVKQYLPAEEKNNLLEIVIQQSATSTIINSFALDIFFHTFLVIKYTNIEFSEDDMENLFELYDKLEQNGIISAVCSEMNSGEYTELYEDLSHMADNYQKYITSTTLLVDRASSFLRDAASALKEINWEDFKNIASETLQTTKEE